MDTKQTQGPSWRYRAHTREDHFVINRNQRSPSVAIAFDEDDAEFIVTCCNNYENARAQVTELKAQRDELALRLKGAAERLRSAWKTTDDDDLADEWARYENHIYELLAKLKGGDQ